MSAEALRQIWPEWQIEGKPLGRGSFGVVYKAVRRDHNVESYAAIKVISIPADPSEVDSLRSEGLDLNATRTYLQSIVNDFVSEIQLMESLKGVQNIVSVEDYKVVERTDEIGWDIYIRMELLTSFNAYICDKKLTEKEVIRLGCDICTALEICAKRNIIHRDIKPENIFINDFGYFKLGDFGIARKMENMTGGLSQKGTFNYMAPEVANSGEYDARVDTYSLGIVLYRLLNGNRLPFLDTEKQLLNPNERRNAVDRRLRGEKLPAPCDASPVMAAVILRACAYDPDMRFASATEMKQALMKVANGTYQMGTDDPDKTTSVRRTPENYDRTTSVRRAPDSYDKTTSVRRAPSDYDKTTSVRKAPAASDQKSAPAVGTFGSAPKKKSKLPAVLITILAIVLLTGAGIFAASKLLNLKDIIPQSEFVSEAADHSRLDEEQIASVISEAEALAAEKDYEGALAKAKAGLVTYPDSQELRDKADGYTEALNAHIKAETLDEAKTLADSGDYVSAIALIKSAQKTRADDADYQTALEAYSTAYREELISSAAESAAKGDYTTAITIMGQAIETFGNNAELTDIITQYKQADVSAAIETAQALSDKSEYEQALSLLNEALNNYPGNSELAEAILAIEDAQKTDHSASAAALGQSLTALNPNQNPATPKTPEEHDISGGLDKANAVEVQKEDLYHTSFPGEEQDAWFTFSTSSNYSAYSIKILNNSVNTTLDVTLYDSYDNEIKKQSLHKGETRYLDVDLESNTVYWLKVNRSVYDSKVSGNYQFSVNEKICDAGMKQEEAFYADLGVQYTKSFDIIDICDWFRFIATGNYATYQFSMKNNSVNTTLYLTVFDEYNTELGSVSAHKGNSCILDLELPADREYTVKISRSQYEGGACGNYQISISEMICDAGLRQAEAFPLPLNEPFQGTVDTSFAEWYVYEFTENKSYTLELINNNINTTVYAYAYDELGTELWGISAWKNGTAEKSFDVSAGTRLYVKITRSLYELYQFGNYTLTVY